MGAVDRLANGVHDLGVSEADGQIASGDDVMAPRIRGAVRNRSQLVLGAPLRRCGEVENSSRPRMRPPQASVNYRRFLAFFRRFDAYR